MATVSIGLCFMLDFRSFPGRLSAAGPILSSVALGRGPTRSPVFRV